MRVSRLFAMTAVIVSIMTSCVDPVLPTADFTVENVEITVYDTVSFTNTSADADSYSWDFGDGSVSTDVNPTHVYTEAGSFTVKLLATNVDGEMETMSDVVVSEFMSYYKLDEVQYEIDSTMFWYVDPRGGDPYIRLITPVSGQDYPDLLKLYPNKGLNELQGTYTWNAEKPIGSYDAGYTAEYNLMQYAWTSIGKTGSGDLVITEMDEGIYKIEAEFVLSVGDYNWTTFEFEETSTSNIVLEYMGGIKPL